MVEPWEKKCTGVGAGVKSDGKFWKNELGMYIHIVKRLGPEIVSRISG